MIKVENIEVFNFEGAIRGCRNPLNSWDKSDSGYIEYEDWEKADTEETWKFVVGEHDLDLMKRLYKAGTEHRKYLRQIFVSMDIVAPLYWWKEADQYRIGVTTNSCSTMHRIHTKEFTFDDFSCEHLSQLVTNIKDSEETCNYDYREVLQLVINALNASRVMYLKTKDKDYWWQMIQLLPSSYNQRRTITMNYENVMTIINQRTGHKLDEWGDLVKILHSLPYVDDIRGEIGEDPLDEDAKEASIPDLRTHKESQ